ncbi:MAG: hypothetical protein SOX83_08695, partial [Sodaliphilus sp.]|nr:hypothetical protein [Sodaliphilus sp.]
FAIGTIHQHTVKQPLNPILVAKEPSLCNHLMKIYEKLFTLAFIFAKKNNSDGEFIYTRL